MSTPFRLSLSSNDPDEAHEWMREHYMPLSARILGERDQFHARHLDLTLGGLRASIFENSMATQLESAPPRDYVLVVRTLSGKYGALVNDQAVAASPDESFLHDPDSTHQIGWYQNLRLQVLRLDRAELERIAAERWGGEQTPSVHFSLSRPVDAQKGRQWLQTLNQLSESFTTDTAVHSPLATQQAFRTVANALLDCFPVSSRQPVTERERRAEPGAVQRAVHFIEQSVDHAVDLHRIAQAARSEPRELERAFRQRFNCTPMDYLQRMRLERAHHELQTTDPNSGTGVTDIAARWGFAHVGQFAATYHARYGHRPSHTLCI